MFDLNPLGVIYKENLSLTLRPDAVSFDRLTAFDMGPVDWMDLSEGLYARAWRLRIDGTNAYLTRSNAAINAWDEQYEYLLFTCSSHDISEFDLTFDQNARAMVSWTQEGRIWIYYYDPISGTMQQLNLCDGRTPRARLDDRTIGVAWSDILLFYLNNTNDRLEYRLQRDRYTIVYPIETFTNVANKYLELLAMAPNRRMYLYFSEQDTSTNLWSLGSWHSAPYPANMEDASIASTGDYLQEVTKRLLYITGEMEPAAITLSGDSLYNVQIRLIIKEAVLYDMKIQSSDSLLSSFRRLAIHTTVMEDESISLDGDYIISALRILRFLHNQIDYMKIDSSDELIAVTRT